MRVVFIGGGKASVRIIEYLHKSEDVTVVALIDLDDSSPGSQKARQLGILTSKNMEETLTRDDIDLILEITGNKDVLKKVLELKKENQDLMSAGGAWLMQQAVQSIHTKKKEIAEELSELRNQMKDVMKILDGTVTDVRSILTKMDMLSINGSIAAGQSGSNDFVIIAERMGSLAKEVDTAMRRILESSEKGNEVINAIREAEDKLKNAS